MSSTITVYLVSIDRLRQLLGSRDQATIRAVVTGREDFLHDVDEIDEDAGMSCADAIAELVNGEVSEDGPGYLYGYALEAICSSVGKELPNVSGICSGVNLD